MNPQIERSYYQKRTSKVNPSSISSKSLTQSRYMPGSNYNFDNSLNRNRSRWGNELKSKNNNYDFNMFSNYINSTFQTPSRNRPSELNTNSSLTNKKPIYQNPYKNDTFNVNYNVKQPSNIKTYSKKVPTMTESRFMRSSSANNLHQIPLTSNSNYLQSNGYNIPKEQNPTRTSTYRVVMGTPTTELQNGRFQGYSIGQNDMDYTSSTGGGLSHLVTTRMNKGTTKYMGGTREGLVQSMYKEKPSNLLQMKYGNTKGNGMRF